MRILIIGKKSFLAKNFINKYKKDKIFYFDSYFSNNYKKFLKKIYSYVQRKKIKHIINFAGNNDNSVYPSDKNNILRDNFILPIALVNLFKEKKVNFTFFSSAEINKIDSLSNNNLYALSKFFLQDSLKFIFNKNKISLIEIDNVYGPHDINFNRLIPSIMLKILTKKKIKINLRQNRKLIYVKDVLPIIFKTLKNKKNLSFVTIKGEQVNILKLWKYINKIIKNKKLQKKNYFNNFVKTFEWYKNNLSKIRKSSKKYQ